MPLRYIALCLYDTAYMRVYTGRYEGYIHTWVWMMELVGSGSVLACLGEEWQNKKDTTCYTNLCVIKHIPTIVRTCAYS